MIFPNHLFKCFLIHSFFLVSIIEGGVSQNEQHVPILSFGGGYLDGGSRHSGGIGQIEYRWKPCFAHLRPQSVVVFPEFCSIYAGLGIAYEWEINKYMRVTPSFTPGLYYQGQGRDLGFPVEFRSALAIEFVCKGERRLGCELSHTSNAHLGKRNPGLNAFVVKLSRSILYSRFKLNRL